PRKIEVDGSAGDRQVASSRLAGALVGDDFEVDFLAFVEAAQAGLLDCADVDEHVLATLIRLDESVALCRVEPLHSSRSHGKFLLDKPSNSAQFSCAARYRIHVVSSGAHGT